MNALAAYGLIAHALIFGALVSLLPLGEWRPRVALAATTLALLVGIAPGVHGIFGMPSVTLLQLALLQLAGRSPSPFTFGPALGVLTFAACFYGLAYGSESLDPYPLGYQPWPIFLALIPVAAALCWRRMPMGAHLLSVNLLAYATGVFPNFWDVLIDPLLVVLALAIVSMQCWARFSASRRR